MFAVRGTFLVLVRRRRVSPYPLRFGVDRALARREFSHPDRRAPAHSAPVHLVYAVTTGMAAAPPPAPPAPSPAQTNVARLTVGGGAGARDEWTVPRNSPILQSLLFLEFEVPAAGNALVEQGGIQGALLATLLPPATAAARAVWRGAMLLRSLIAPKHASAMLHELNVAGLFRDSYYKVEQWGLAVLRALAGPLAGKRNLFVPTPAMLETMQAFDRAAVRGRNAVAAKPGPAEIKFLEVLSWDALVHKASQVDTALPCAALARAHVLLGSRQGFAIRDDADSHVRVVGGDLRARVITWSGLGAAPSDALLARSAADFLANVFLMMPIELRSGGGSPDDLQSDIRDGVTMLAGKEVEIAACTFRRVFTHLDHFAILSKFGPVVTSATEAAQHFGRLSGHFNSETLSGTAVQIVGGLADLEKALTDRGQQIEELVAEPSASLSQVVTTLIEAHDLVSASAPGDGAVAAVVGSDGGEVTLSGSELTQGAINAAIASNAFRDAVRDIEGRVGRDRLETALQSGSLIIQRFILLRPAWLRGKHPLFGLLKEDLPELCGYFAR